MYTVQFSGLLLKRYHRGYVQTGTRLTPSFRHYGNYGKFRECPKKISLWLRERSGRVAEACVRQFEFIAAQRLRRSLQIFHLRARMWEKVVLKEFMKSWRNRSLRNSKRLLTSTIGVTVFNWEHERISDEELNSYKQEIEGIYKLRDSTVVCPSCQLRIVIDVQQPGIKYCTCRDKISASSNQDPDGWRPYIEREDMLIWRRKEPNAGGLYAYKVYGSFADVTAEDFLQTQIDVDYRRNWDPTARELRVIDTDPMSDPTGTDRSDILYWETIWPRLFANRDYVYQRKWVVDKDRRLIIIISKGTEHPDAPIKPGIYRVSTYWSYMVIRPYTEFHEPGIEFGLTYFDDPGVNIPTAVTAWVAMTGLPDFLIRMREASKNYQRYKESLDSFNTSYVSLKMENVQEDKVPECCAPNLERDETLRKEVTASVTEQTDMFKFKEDQPREENDAEEEDEENEDGVSSTKECRGLLGYFFLAKLFAW
ncbi:stAR-related lipid transfer protein 7, mitochondrial [Nomia melanderi]|uniref:stAR-related lipid transfer protein 7, mitochondrial n=1 Tax=Nomia melanderi TaxID=2448451 RepID=UPI0013044F16|nr:stAR-related lipid transfer protein 7, mitochondrial-like [Nomia melanderi]